MDVAVDMNAAALQRLFDDLFPIARHMGVRVETAEAARVVLLAPLAPNANHAGTAFGGSLFSVAALASWGWLTGLLTRDGIDAEAVVQESRMRYLAPVRGELRATLDAPAAPEIARFRRMLERAGRGRIDLAVRLDGGVTPAAQFEGTFVATIRRNS